MSRVFNNPREVKREYGWGVKEIEVDIHSPLDSNIGETEYTFLNETKKAYYDKSLVDKDGKIIDGRYTPLAEHPVLNSTDVSETKMWRGISAAEMSSINDTGEVKSFGDMNFESQVGENIHGNTSSASTILRYTLCGLVRPANIPKTSIRDRDEPHKKYP